MDHKSACVLSASGASVISALGVVMLNDVLETKRKLHEAEQEIRRLEEERISEFSKQFDIFTCAVEKRDQQDDPFEIKVHGDLDGPSGSPEQFFLELDFHSFPGLDADISSFINGPMDLDQTQLKRYFLDNNRKCDTIWIVRNSWTCKDRTPLELCPTGTLVVLRYDEAMDVFDNAGLSFILLDQEDQTKVTGIHIQEFMAR